MQKRKNKKVRGGQFLVCLIPFSPYVCKIQTYIPGFAWLIKEPLSISPTRQS